MVHSLKITKEQKKIQKTRDSRYIYKNELDKSCFKHDMAYGDFKDLNIKTAAEKVLRDKTFDVAKNPKIWRRQCGLASMVNNFFDKETSGGAATLAN